MTEKWLWAPRDRDGDGVAATPSFSSQAEAETWLGDHWRSLADAGATSVTLMRDAAVVYEMSLEES
jgi:hypothetical protein